VVVTQDIEQKAKAHIKQIDRGKKKWGRYREGGIFGPHASGPELRRKEHWETEYSKKKR